MRHNISTPSQAIEALGGTKAVAALFGVDPRVVLNWHSRGLPPDTYAVMGQALMLKKMRFSAHSLFGQRQSAMAPWDASAIETRPYRRNAGNGK